MERVPSGSSAGRPLWRWAVTHFFRITTALATLAAFGWSFLYRPEWLTWWLRTTMDGIEAVSDLIPYPWGDQFEVALRGIGGSFWIQITLAIIILRVVLWVIAALFRRSFRSR